METVTQKARGNCEERVTMREAIDRRKHARKTDCKETRERNRSFQEERCLAGQREESIGSGPALGFEAPLAAAEAV